MSTLNRGKINIGGTNNVSYGNQSPAVDAVPLLWIAGDWRQYVGTSTTILGWRCTVGGTPGTWVEIDTGAGPGTPPPILTVPFLLDGPLPAVGQPVYGAPATPDWLLAGEIPLVRNLWKIPDLRGSPGHLSLIAWLTLNQPDVNVANGLTFSIVNQTGTIVGGGTATTQLNANPATIGGFYLLDNLPIADVTTADSLALVVTADALTVNEELQMSLSLFVDV